MISTQLEFRAATAARRGRGPTQNDKVLAILQANLGRWVPMPKLYMESGAMAVHSRVSDLRKLGHNIEHKNEWHDGACWSFYRLVTQEESLSE